MGFESLIPLANDLLGKVSPQLSAALSVSLFVSPRRHPRPQEEKIVWEQGQSIRLRSGRSLRKYGQGPGVFCVHGWEGRGSQFWNWVQPLVTQGFTVFLWDGPAHGDSKGKQTHLIEFTQALNEDLKELNTQLNALIGHSFGGSSTLLLQALHSFAVPHSIVIASPSQIEGVVERFTTLVRLSPRAESVFRTRLEELADKKVHEIDFRILGQTIRSRTLIVHDSDDKEIPVEEAYELRSALPTSQIEITHTFGHRRILKASHVIQRVVQFIQTRS